MSFEPNTWKPKDKVTSAHLNRIEQGIAALYPQEQIIAPEQTVTLTAETSFDTGASITLADGVDIDSIAEDFNVIVGGTLLAYQNNVYLGQLDSDAYAIVQFNPIGETGNYSLGLLVVDQMSDPSSAQVVPGDYIVEISKHVIPNAVLLTPADDSLGISYNGIIEAFMAGKQIWLTENGGAYSLSAYYVDSGTYTVTFPVPQDGGIFGADDPDEDLARTYT